MAIKALLALLVLAVIAVTVSGNPAPPNVVAPVPAAIPSQANIPTMRLMRVVRAAARAAVEVEHLVLNKALAKINAAAEKKPKKSSKKKRKAIKIEDFLSCMA